MSVETIFVVGLNHLRAPLACREKAAVAPADLLARLGESRAACGLEEAVILSTCSRVEVIGASADRERAVARCAQWLLARAGDDAQDALYAHTGSEALAHLVRVAAGLDSWIVGESEILAQIKNAYHFALERGFTGKILNRVLQGVIGAAKRVRSGSGIQNGIHSIGGAAALAARRIFGAERGGRVLIFGAGQAAEAVVRHLAAKKFSRITVANRRLERARALAEPLGGEAVSIEEGFKLLGEVEVAIFSVSGDRPLLQPEVLAARRQGRAAPLFLIDLGMPRNVDSACGRQPHVHLVDLDGLKKMVRESMLGKAPAQAHAEELAAQEARECRAGLEKAASWNGLKEKIPSGGRHD